MSLNLHCTNRPRGVTTGSNQPPRYRQAIRDVTAQPHHTLLRFSCIRYHTIISSSSPILGQHLNMKHKGCTGTSSTSGSRREQHSEPRWARGRGMRRRGRLGAAVPPAQARQTATWPRVRPPSSQVDTSCPAAKRAPLSPRTPITSHPLATDTDYVTPSRHGH